MSQGVLPFFLALGFPWPLSAGQCFSSGGMFKKMLYNRTVAEMLLQGTKKHLDFGVLC